MRDEPGGVNRFQCEMSLNRRGQERVRCCGGMNITMQYIERLTLDQMREFVEGSRTIGFVAPKREAIYESIERVLKSQQYRRLGRGGEGGGGRVFGGMMGRWCV